jgi:hypothetical protein
MLTLKQQLLLAWYKSLSNEDQNRVDEWVEKRDPLLIIHLIQSHSNYFLEIITLNSE